VKELASSSSQLPSPPDRGNAELLARPMVMQDEGLLLRDYWRLIRKRLWLIVIFCCGAVVTAALVILMMSPIYTAETTVLIERTPPQVLNIREVLPEPLGPNEYDFYRTQYEILKSQTLAARVIREQGLETNSVFTGEGSEKGFVARLWAKAKGWLTKQEWARRLFPQRLETGEENPLAVKPALIDDYMEKLEIKPVQRTRLVKIALNTPNPELSARLANAHAQAYIRQGLGLRTRANEEAQGFGCAFRL
jgi:polysaccharide biosynthesis transport protein